MVRVGDNRIEEVEVCGGNHVVKRWLVGRQTIPLEYNLETIACN